jgi:polysaccharide lyase family 4-like protein
MRVFWIVVAIMGVIVGSAAVTPAQDAGSLSGRITYAGAPPPKKKVDVTKDKEVCGKSEIYDESLVVGPDKGLKNAVVIVQGAKGGKFASQKVELDQKGCQYVPHVVVVPTTGELDILNSDGILHNIHTQSTANPAVNVAQPKFKKVLTQKFTKPEIIKAACDAHGWMSGWIVVTDHPFVAVTDDKGNFAIKDIPPGKYTVEIWQETLGKQVKEVSIKAKEDAKLTLELAKK